MTIDIEPGDVVTYTGERGYPLDYDKAELSGLAIGNEYYVQAISVDERNTSVRLLGHPGWHSSAIFAANRACGACDPLIGGECGPQVDADGYVTNPSGTGALLCSSHSTFVPAVTDEPVEHEYFVEATIQTVVKATDGYAAALTIKERLAEFIADGYAKNDPIHGTILNIVEEIPAGE